MLAHYRSVSCGLVNGQRAVAEDENPGCALNARPPENAKNTAPPMAWAAAKGFQAIRGGARDWAGAQTAATGGLRSNAGGRSVGCGDRGTLYAVGGKPAAPVCRVHQGQCCFTSPMGCSLRGDWLLRSPVSARTQTMPLVLQTCSQWRRSPPVPVTMACVSVGTRAPHTRVNKATQATIRRYKCALNMHQV